jgi:2-phospho-L-lactate guanylyltransferase
VTDREHPLPQPVSPRWVVIVPVKPAAVGKSRLGLPVEFARAIALDTIEAASRARRVAEVVVVTADAGLAAELDGVARVRVVVEDKPAGIAAAIADGLAGVDADVPRAVLLGDLPALVPDDVDAALGLGQAVAQGFVEDVEGTGTSLVTAGPGQELRQAFGAASAERHRELGLVPLDVPRDSTLRRDVDTREQLLAAAALGVGPRTAALLRRLPLVE